MHGIPMHQRFLTWAYRRLGRYYPFAFVAAELQTVWFIVAGTIGVYSLYYEPAKSDFLLLLGITGALVAVTLTAALVRTFIFMKPLARWIGGERDPTSTATAWSIAVGTPVFLIKRDLWLPIVGVLMPVSVLSAVIYELDWLAFFPLFAGGLVAIGYSGVLHYFAVEAGMRPVLLDINREAAPRMTADIPTVSLRYKLLLALPVISVITGVITSALSSAGDEGGGAALGLDVAVAIFVAGTISLELTLLLTRSILTPIEDLQQGLEKVGEGSYEVSIPVTTNDELGVTIANFNQMAKGLAEREKIREAFGTYLDREVAEYILSDGFRAEGEEVEVSLLFCDVRGFTSFASVAEAPEVVAKLNDLFECIVPIVGRHGGHVDKFVGDGLLAVFGAPQPHRDHADRAVRAAIEMSEQVNPPDSGHLPIGVGVNSGPVVAGSIGGAGRLNFSVIGDAVNVAARVEAATRELDEDVLITDATRGRLDGTIEVRRLGPVQVKGKDEPIVLWAPLARVRSRDQATV